MSLENDERVKQLNELIQVEADPVKLALLAQQLLDLLDEIKSEPRPVSGLLAGSPRKSWK